MNTKRCLICALILWLGGFFTLAQAREQKAPPTPQAGNFLPIRLYTLPGQRPTLLFTTPCLLLAHFDHGNGPLAAVRDTLARAVIATNKVLPVNIEPVCM
jgi:hypothetical protein